MVWPKEGLGTGGYSSLKLNRVFILWRGIVDTIIYCDNPDLASNTRTWISKHSYLWTLVDRQLQHSFGSQNHPGWISAHMGSPTCLARGMLSNANTPSSCLMFPTLLCTPNALYLHSPNPGFYSSILSFFLFFIKKYIRDLTFMTMMTLRNILASCIARMYCKGRRIITRGFHRSK